MRDEQKTKLYENIKQEIRSLLISSPKTKYGGLSGSLLYHDYKELNCGKQIPYVELGFHSFLSLLRSMPDVVIIEQNENSPSYRVHPVYNESTAHIQKMVLEQNDKYEYQYRLYDQNRSSNNNNNPINFYNNGKTPFLHKDSFNRVKTNFPLSAYQPTNKSLYQSIPQNNFLSNNSFQPYFLLPPQKRTYYNKSKEKDNFQSTDILSQIPSRSSDHNDISSTPNTFRETPPNFDFDDYHLDQSIQINEKDFIEQNKNISSVNIITNNLQKDQSIISPPISPLQTILSTTIDDVSNYPSNNIQCSLVTPPSIIEQDKSPPSNNEIFSDVSSSHELQESKIDENDKLNKRLNAALNECIHFRYMHRLCQINFEYRHYPLSNEIILEKSNLEKVAFDKYKNELEEFKKTSQLNSSINEEICRTMFDEYVYLQRNYYYMIKLMKKNKKIN